MSGTIPDITLVKIRRKRVCRFGRRVLGERFLMEEKSIRYVIKFQYKGTEFSGYQVQPEKRTVQGEIELALKNIFFEDIKIYASGRTDARVHALAQIAHFDAQKKFSESQLIHLLNRELPSDISVLEAGIVDEDFDARFDATSKTYIYKFYLSRFEKPLYSNLATRVNDNVNVEKMQEACSYLLGEHDFKSFVARKSGKEDFVRTIYSAKITKTDSDLYEFEISANGFLYNMVRIIFGTLIEVGSGRLKPEEVGLVIESKSRSKAGKTYSPDGLYLKNVEYKKHIQMKRA